MDHMETQKDTAAWIFQVWASFVLAMAASILGILYLPVDNWVRGYMTMAMLFTVGSSFTLAKTVRHNHEAKKIINRLTDAKTEKLLREFEVKDAA